MIDYEQNRIVAPAKLFRNLDFMKDQDKKIPVDDIHKIKQILDILKIKVGKCEITKQVNVLDQNGEIIPMDLMTVLLRAFIRDTLRRKAQKSDIYECLELLGEKHSYNKFLELLPNWDGFDRFPLLYEVFRLGGNEEEKELYCLLLNKWVHSIVAMAMNNDPKNPYNAAGMLVWIGEQSLGKSTTLKKMGLEDKDFFFEAKEYNFKNDESRQETYKYLINELPEFDKILKPSNLQGLKGELTASGDRWREKYARRSKFHNRQSVYAGTVNLSNQQGLLVDDTGERRFFTIQTIGKEKVDNEKLTKEFMLQLYAQCKHKLDVSLNEQGKRAFLNCFHLTPDEERRLNESNEKFKVLNEIELQVADILADYPKDGYNGYELMNCSTFVRMHNIKGNNAVTLTGRYLNKIGMKQDRRRKYELPFQAGNFPTDVIHTKRKS